MKKLFVYKTIGEIEDAIVSADNRCNNILDTVKRTCKAVIEFPAKVHVKVIQVRLNVTDHYLEAKAKTCEALLKEMAEKRKKIAAEQVEARTDLKMLRASFNYPDNPRLK